MPYPSHPISPGWTENRESCGGFPGSPPGNQPNRADAAR